MSTSRSNAIYLNDTPEEVRRKVNTAITDPARIKATDKGHPGICNIYQYHSAFNSDGAPDIEQRCLQGKIGCVACKENLAEKINSFLVPIREKRAFFEARPSFIREAIREGNEKTLKEGAETLDLVREAMHFEYKDLLESVSE
jgi:tryptophanyl-tRNA synthetase